MLRTAGRRGAVLGDGWEASRRPAGARPSTPPRPGAISARSRSRCASRRRSPTTSDSGRTPRSCTPPRREPSAITVLPALFPGEPAPRGDDHGGPAGTNLGRAAPDAARVGAGGTAHAAGPPYAASGELVVEGDGWRVTFDGRTVRIRDMKGIGDLAVLVARPGVGGPRPRADGRRRRRRCDRTAARRTGSARATDAHRRPATRHRRGPRSTTISGRAEQAERELDTLVAELGGRVRPRRAGPPDRVERRAGPLGGHVSGAIGDQDGRRRCIPSWDDTSRTPCAPERGARTGPSTTSTGRWSVDASRCEA